MAPWYEDDGFWTEWGPYLFSSQRLNDAPAETDSAIRLLGVSSGARVLDVCCGEGRHSFELARRGFRVTGVDRTRAYLERLRSEALARDLRIDLILADVRSLHIRAAFDFAINMFTSFGYFESDREDFKAAANVREALRPGGKFLIDTEGREPFARDFRRRDWYRHDDGTIGLQERAIRDGWERMDARWILIRDGRVVRETRVSSRIYSGAEMRALLLAAGFRAVKLYGDLYGAPYDDLATRLIAVAVK
jgi:SAM-dependent methyltransferase